MSKISRIALSFKTPSLAVVGASNINFSVAVFFTNDDGEVPAEVHLTLGKTRDVMIIQCISSDPRFHGALLEFTNYTFESSYTYNIDFDYLHGALDEHLWRVENDRVAVIER